MTLGRGQRSNIIKFRLPGQFQRLLYHIVMCVLTNERYKTYQTGYLFSRLYHAPGVGQSGCPGVKKTILNIVM